MPEEIDLNEDEEEALERAWARLDQQAAEGEAPAAAPITPAEPPKE